VWETAGRAYPGEVPTKGGWEFHLGRATAVLPATPLAGAPSAPAEVF